jgi:phosphate transport system substrate-binding protein
VSVTGGGSGTGFQALIEGTANIATASRKIKATEAEAAKGKGITPVEKTIGYDGIAVIVNKANPVGQATIDQLSDLYTGQTEDWAALGGSGEVMLVSRDTASGTFEYFKERVVQRGEKESGRDYTDAKLMLPSNAAIRDQVATTASAIGYIGLGYLDDSVKALAIVNADGKAVLPGQAAVKDGTYSISRPLFMYTAQDPGEAVQEYLDWILGEAGQKVVGEEGFVGVE